MRPSTYSLSPFFTYFSTMSASCEPFVFQTTQRCHSVFSCFAPDWSFHVRLVASEKVATRLPPVVERTSGSFPRFPINVTLFKLRLTISSWRESVVLARMLASSPCRCATIRPHPDAYDFTARSPSHVHRPRRV